MKDFKTLIDNHIRFKNVIHNINIDIDRNVSSSYNTTMGKFYTKISDTYKKDGDIHDIIDSAINEYAKIISTSGINVVLIVSMIAMIICIMQFGLNDTRSIVTIMMVTFSTASSIIVNHMNIRGFVSSLKYISCEQLELINLIQGLKNKKELLNCNYESMMLENKDFMIHICDEIENAMQSDDNKTDLQSLLVLIIEYMKHTR